MRLTLRTLLAYLDDTLEPAQAKVIGQKVAESETAQELIARIKQVTRRRRLANPPPGGSTNIDPNTLAEYLENSLDTEHLDKVEQICLASDANLAELAACHQILTQLQAEQTMVPPTSRQRMYGLVKGREAIPFRKPPQRHHDEPEEAYVESREQDETLRLGLPLLRRQGGWTQTLAMVGGGLALAALLALAIVQVLHLPAAPGPRVPANPNAVAQNNKEDKPVEPGPGKVAPADKAEKAPTDKAAATDKSAPTDKALTDKATPTDKAAATDKAAPVTDKAATDKPAPDKTLVTKVVDEGPSTVRGLAGSYRLPEPPSTSILLQWRKPLWQRLAVNKPEVFTAEPLVSLPGYRSQVDVLGGLRLTLWGHLPELYPLTPPIRESSVVIHHSARFDLDLTLSRGRIAIVNYRPSGPAHVRVRFDNPTNPEHKEFWDLTLLDKGTEVLLDLFSNLPADGKFHRNPMDPDRLGPTANVALVVLEGQVSLKIDDATYSMQKPPGPALYVWNSVRSPSNSPSTLEKLPDFVLRHPAYPEKYDPRVRAGMVEALDSFSTSLAAKIDAALADAVHAQDAHRRKLAVNCMGAIDNVDGLLAALTNEQFRDVRVAAIDELRFWLAQGRDHDLFLHDRATKRYDSARPADILLSLLVFNYSPQALSRPDTYEEWIDYLNNANLAIREVAAWHLYQVVSAGQKIVYDAAGDSNQRARAQQEWRKLIPRGQLPPAPSKK